MKPPSIKPRIRQLPPPTERNIKVTECLREIMMLPDIGEMVTAIVGHNK